MSTKIETQTLLNRTVNGEEIADISVTVHATYAPPFVPFANSEDDSAEAQIDRAYVTADVRNLAGEIAFRAGERIWLTDAEEIEAERACLANA